MVSTLRLKCIKKCTEQQMTVAAEADRSQVDHTEPGNNSELAVALAAQEPGPLAAAMRR